MIFEDVLKKILSVVIFLILKHHSFFFFINGAKKFGKINSTTTRVWFSHTVHRFFLWLLLVVYYSAEEENDRIVHHHHPVRTTISYCVYGAYLAHDNGTKKFWKIPYVLRRRLARSVRIKNRKSFRRDFYYYFVYLPRPYVCVYSSALVRWPLTGQPEKNSPRQKQKKQTVFIEEYSYAQNNVIFPPSSLLSVSSFASTNNPEQ